MLECGETGSRARLLTARPENRSPVGSNPTAPAIFLKGYRVQLTCVYCFKLFTVRKNNYARSLARGAVEFFCSKKHRGLYQREQTLRKRIELLGHCEYCNKKLVKLYASGRFCNRACANGFSTVHDRDGISKRVSKTVRAKFPEQQKPQVKVGRGRPGLPRAPWNDARRVNWSATVQRQYQNGRTVSLKVNKGTSRHIEILSLTVRSSYEEAFAHWLIQLKLPVLYEIQRFTLDLNGKPKIYIPDFCVEGIWVEIKNKHNVIRDKPVLNAFQQQYSGEKFVVIVGNSNWKPLNIVERDAVFDQNFAVVVKPGITRRCQR